MDISKSTDAELVTDVPVNSQHWFQTPHVLEMQRRLLVAIRDFNEASGKQAKTMIRLTWAIVWLTVVLGVIAAIQVYLMVKGGA